MGTFSLSSWTLQAREFNLVILTHRFICTKLWRKLAINAYRGEARRTEWILPRIANSVQSHAKFKSRLLGQWLCVRVHLTSCWTPSGHALQKSAGTPLESFNRAAKECLGDWPTCSVSRWSVQKAVLKYFDETMWRSLYSYFIVFALGTNRISFSKTCGLSRFLALYSCEKIKLKLKLKCMKYLVEASFSKKKQTPK